MPQRCLSMLEGQLEISLLDPWKPLELHRSPSCRHRISAGVQAQPKLPKCNCQPYGAEGGPGPAGLCRAEDTKVNETGEGGCEVYITHSHCVAHFQ